VAVQPVVISDSGPTAAPATYTVPGSQEIQLKSISAVFDGSAAGGSFEPTCSIYSQSGLLLSRTKATGTVAGGSSAEVTFAPFSLSTSVAAATSTGIYNAFINPSPPAETLASGVVGTWVQLGSFLVGDSNVGSRVSLAGGNEWTITDPGGLRTSWILGAQVAFTPTGPVAAAGVIACGVYNVAGGDVMTAQTITYPVSFNTPVYLACSVNRAVASGQRYRIVAYQNSGTTWYYSSPVSGFSFQADFLGEF